MVVIVYVLLLFTDCLLYTSFSGLWWASVLPGLYIMLLVFGINLLGDFLRDELNPRLK